MRRIKEDREQFSHQAREALQKEQETKKKEKEREKKRKRIRYSKTFEKIVLIYEESPSENGLTGEKKDENKLSLHERRVAFAIAQSIQDWLDNFLMESSVRNRKNVVLRQLLNRTREAVVEEMLLNNLTAQEREDTKKVHTLVHDMVTRAQIRATWSEGESMPPAFAGLEHHDVDALFAGIDDNPDPLATAQAVAKKNDWLEGGGGAGTSGVAGSAGGTSEGSRRLSEAYYDMWSG